MNEWRWRVSLGLGIALLSSLAIPADAGPTARISESGQVLELEYEGAGRIYTDTIPLYRSDKLRYFSAGVGIEERSATYPSFPLKMVFTAGGKPYVAGVSVTVQQSNGATIASIPQEHVTGPWLFLDAPDGLYQISATMGNQIEYLNNVRIDRGTQKTLYVRWREP
ncbi:hypothetical protein [Nitrospira sp. Nam80]